MDEPRDVPQPSPVVDPAESGRAPQGRGKSVHAHVTGLLVFNSSGMIVAAALAGHGLAWVRDDAVGELIAARRLVSVLDDWAQTLPDYHAHDATRS